MSRFETRRFYSEFFILPTIGVVKMMYGVYDYKYRIAFAWLNLRASIGIVKVRTSL